MLIQILEHKQRKCRCLYQSMQIQKLYTQQCDSSTDDSDVKEQKACHQRHYNLWDPSSGEALLRDEPLLRGMYLVPVWAGIKVDWVHLDSFCKQTAPLALDIDFTTPDQSAVISSLVCVWPWEESFRRLAGQYLMIFLVLENNLTTLQSAWLWNRVLINFWNRCYNVIMCIFCVILWG